VVIFQDLSGGQRTESGQGGQLKLFPSGGRYKRKKQGLLPSKRNWNSLRCGGGSGSSRRRIHSLIHLFINSLDRIHTNTVSYIHFHVGEVLWEGILIGKKVAE